MRVEAGVGETDEPFVEPFLAQQQGMGEKLTSCKPLARVRYSRSNSSWKSTVQFMVGIMDIKPYGGKSICGRPHGRHANLAPAGKLQLEELSPTRLVSGPDWLCRNCALVRLESELASVVSYGFIMYL
jgi:hypothetical protein